MPRPSSIYHNFNKKGLLVVNRPKLLPLIAADLQIIRLNLRICGY